MASENPYKALEVDLTQIAFEVDRSFTNREDITIEALRVNPLTKTLSEEQMQAVIKIIEKFFPKGIPTMQVSDPKALELANRLGIKFGNSARES